MLLVLTARKGMQGEDSTVLVLLCVRYWYSISAAHMCEQELRLYDLG